MLTMPKARELDPMQRVRYSLGRGGRLAVLLHRLERLLSRQPGPGRGARCAAAPRGRRKCRAGRAGPSAAVPGQSAFPVQHAQFAVVARDDGPHGSSRDHASGAFDLFPDKPLARSKRRRDASPRRSTSSGSISTSRRRASPTGSQSRSTCHAELEQARMPALLLQPIVENALKYGVSKSRKAVLIPSTRVTSTTTAWCSRSAIV